MNGLRKHKKLKTFNFLLLREPFIHRVRPVSSRQMISRTMQRVVLVLPSPHPSPERNIWRSFKD